MKLLAGAVVQRGIASYSAVSGGALHWNTERGLI
jgi:hypothetical protein